MNPLDCTKCGGHCCKSMAGSYIPQDIRKNVLTLNGIYTLLKAGTHAIDWWEAKNPIYYLRPRHKNESAIKGSWGGECIHLDLNKGCELPFSHRPFQCRMLTPDLRGTEIHCFFPDNIKAEKYHCAIAWRPHQRLLRDVINKFHQTQTNENIYSNKR